MTTVTLTDGQVAQRGTFVEQLLQSRARAFNILSLYLGHRLGLYQALSQGRPVTAFELAIWTGTHEPHVYEWLAWQAEAGILEVAEAQVKPQERRFHLPPARAKMLIDRGHLHTLEPLAQLAAGSNGSLAAIVNAYYTAENSISPRAIISNGSRTL